MDIAKLPSRAGALIEAGDVAGTEALLLDGLRRDPGDHGLWAEAGHFFIALGRGEDGVACLGRAWSLGNRDIRTAFRLGIGELAHGHFAEAEAWLRKAVAIDERYGDSWRDLGLALAYQGRFAEALECLERAAMRLDDGSGVADAMWRIRFQAGDWDRAWSDFDRAVPPDLAERWQAVHGTRHRPWQGEPLAGAELVVFSHGGHGDIIQNLRFLEKLAARGAERIALILPPALTRLVAASPLVRDAGAAAIELLGPNDRIDDRHGYFTWFEGLAARFRAKPGQVPPAPYLSVPAIEQAKWAARLRNPEDGARRIGLSWRGSPELPQDRWRSIPLEHFAPLFELPACRWVALQTAPLSPQEQAILRQYGVADASQDIGDFADAAAAMAALDLVIAVDSAPAHLAGALGRPVWLLNRANSEWRWGWRQNTSLWYSTMTIFNQDCIGDWSRVLGAIREALR